MRTGRFHLRRFLPNVAGILWVLAAPLCMLAPALSHGGSLYNTGGAYDQVDFFIPMTTLGWTQVHGGHLPLWNPYNALGMPLAFDWQSAPFGLPALIGYLFPLHYAYTVQILTTLVVAGTGVYVLGRVLRIGVLGCAMAATVYELSGPFVGWLGWPHASVMSWAGWLFAATLMIFRGNRRSRTIPFFAVVLAFAIYAGQAEFLLLLGLTLLVFVVVRLALRALWLGGAGHVLRPIGDLALGAVAGAALGAPLLLPGLQLAGGSVINDHSLAYPPFYQAPPLNTLVYVSSSHSSGFAYIGVTAIALAVVALACRWRHPEVGAFGATAVVLALVAFFPPMISLLQRLPRIGGIHWNWATVPLAFAAAVLSGFGLDVLVNSYAKRKVTTVAAIAFAVLLAGLLAFGLSIHGRVPKAIAGSAISINLTFILPAAEIALGLGVVVALIALAATSLQTSNRSRTGRDARGFLLCALLLAGETFFLVVAGATWSSNGHFVYKTDLALKSDVGSGVLASGAGSCFPFPTAILQDDNILTKVHELSVYDPITPSAYLRAWRGATGQEDYEEVAIFCPNVTSVAVARRFGVQFVLEPAGVKGPQGAVFDAKVGDDELFRIPDSSEATLTALVNGRSLPPADALGSPVAVTHPGPAAWSLVTHAAKPSVLRLHLTDVPGWHATIDGRPLTLLPYSGVMFQARIPQGNHDIQLRYWPNRFSLGIVVAGICAVVLLAAIVVAAARSRRWAPGKTRHELDRRAPVR